MLRRQRVTVMSIIIINMVINTFIFDQNNITQISNLPTISTRINKPSKLNNKTKSSPIMQDTSIIPSFPIDIVYTFAGEQTSDGQRLRYNGELRYSLRTIYKYAPWVHAIFILISDDTLHPSWIIPNKTANCSIPLYIIRHSDIYSNLNNAKNNHNSDSIESRLHHIPGLSNHFIYFNDDFFLFQYTSYLFFFNENGIPRYPKSHFWNHYNNPKKNPILLIYPKQNFRKIIKTFPHLQNMNIPYRTKNHFSEHLPRPYTRTSWYELENYYSDWFIFVESHKKRFCSIYPYESVSGCLEEIIYILMITYRLLNHYVKTNETFKAEIQKIEDNKLYRLVSKQEFEIDVYQHGYTNTNYFHLWLTGHNKFSVKDLRMFTDWMIQWKPHTVCLNDVLAMNVTSGLYKAELRFLHRFYRKYLNDIVPEFEKRNDFIEPVLQKYLSNLSEIKYNDYGWKMENNKDSKKINLLFLHIPRNAGTSIEEFGLEHKLTWGKYLDGNNEFLCKNDKFNSSAQDNICCHAYHLPPIYMYNEWNMKVMDTFCVIFRHPYKRLLSQYKYRLLKMDYKKEEMQLMVDEYGNNEDVNSDSYWCKTE
eukprot:18288_1